MNTEQQDPWPGVTVEQTDGWVDVTLGLRTQRLHPHQAFAIAQVINDAANRAMALRYHQAEMRHTAP